MLRLILFVAAAALLSGCATLPPVTPSFGANAHGLSFDSEAPAESAVFNRSPPSGFAALVALDRRSFSPPLRRLPEMRAMVVTVADRQRRRVLRVRRA